MALLSMLEWIFQLWLDQSIFSPNDQFSVFLRHLYFLELIRSFLNEIIIEYEISQDNIRLRINFILILRLTVK